MQANKLTIYIATFYIAIKTTLVYTVMIVASSYIAIVSIYTTDSYKLWVYLVRTW